MPWGLPVIRQTTTTLCFLAGLRPSAVLYPIAISAPFKNCMKGHQAGHRAPSMKERLPARGTNVTSIDAMAREAKLEEKLMSKVSLRLIPFMLVLYVISYLDRINISFAALQMNHDLGLSDAAFGFGGGIFFLGYCIFGIPSNLVIQRFGPRRWVSAIMVAWGLMTISFCCVKSAPQFWVLRFFLGVAEAGFFPGMILYLHYWYPGRYYGLAVARFMLAIPVAGLLGSGTAAAAL